MDESHDEQPRPTPGEPAPSAGGSAPAEPAWKRRQRLAEIFGDVLPSTTSDERDPAGDRGAAAESGQDAWLRAQVPPHHGGS